MNKQMTKTNGTNLRAPELKTPTVSYAVTKRLSPPSLVLIGFLYSLALVKITIFYNKPQSIQQGYLTSKDLKRILDEKLAQELNRELLLPIDYLSRNEFATLRRDLMKELNILKSKQTLLLENSKNQTKNENQVYSNSALEIKAEENSHKVFIYNSKNKNLLWTKYNQRRNRLQEKLEKQKNELLHQLDFKNEQDVEKFKDFQDQSEFKLKELQEDYHSQINKFQKQQYLLIEN